MPALPEYEKLGAFYLGKEYDLAARKRGDGLLLYDSKDLVTHAVCVGMTGSGKTGLCIGLIEEAAIDGIPSIVIDPKGDLTNLMLTFPELRPSDFAPWVNQDDARRKGLSPEEFAGQQAANWKRGLEEWGQDADRIRRLKEAADCVIYTPGASAGVPLSIMKSFEAPPQAVMEDRDLYRERIATTATSLLGLLGIAADPVRSREHILLSTLFEAAWTAGRNLDLGGLVTQVQSPPIQRVGVMDLEAFYPSAQRFELAMQLNSLLASPGFSAWTEGEPLDVQSMLYGPTGKPRIAVVSIAHLSDSERMFFVALLFNQILAWVRKQSGTTSLRALIYMDEIAGYFPPVASVPSKAPMLTLMKQARAFGVGMLLATQNPVDIDYKGLSNAGTWFIGRLQTERDKARVLDGLEGAAAGASAKFDRSQIERTLSALGSRVFLMNNVHDDAPTIFETRWVLSYLAGPLTRTQIRTLMSKPATGGVAAVEPVASVAASGATSVVAPSRASAAAAGDRAANAREPQPAAPPAGTSATRPVLPPDVPQYFAPVRTNRPGGAALRYEPRVLGLASIYYNDAKQGVETEVPIALASEIGAGPVPVDWQNSEETHLSEGDLEAEPAPDATFGPLGVAAARAKSYADWKRDLTDFLFRSEKLELFRSPGLKESSRPDEAERDFRARLAHAARELRDAQVDKLRAKYQSKLATLQERHRKARAAVEAQSSQATLATVSTAASVGSAIFTALFGRSRTAAGAATAVRGAGRVLQEKGDVKRAEETAEAVAVQIRELEAQLQAEIDEIGARIDPATEELLTVSLKPKKTNIKVRAVALIWTPVWITATGGRTPACGSPQRG